MNDEIKEILQDVIDDIYQCGEYIGQAKKLEKILDYITNLQERCEYLERSNNRREDEIMSLRDECVDGETYKSINEKAIEYIGNGNLGIPRKTRDKFIAILKGKYNTPQENLYKYTPENGFRLVGEDND